MRARARGRRDGARLARDGRASRGRRRPACEGALPEAPRPPGPCLRLKGLRRRPWRDRRRPRVDEGELADAARVSPNDRRLRPRRQHLVRASGSERRPFGPPACGRAGALPRAFRARAPADVSSCGARGGRRRFAASVVFRIRCPFRSPPAPGSLDTNACKCRFPGSQSVRSTSRAPGPSCRNDRVARFRTDQHNRAWAPNSGIAEAARGNGERRW